MVPGEEQGDLSNFLLSTRICPCKSWEVGEQQGRKNTGGRSASEHRQRRLPQGCHLGLVVPRQACRKRGRRPHWPDSQIDQTIPAFQPSRGPGTPTLARVFRGAHTPSAASWLGLLPPLSFSDTLPSLGWPWAWRGTPWESWKAHSTADRSSRRLLVLTWPVLLPRNSGTSSDLRFLIGIMEWVVPARTPQFIPRFPWRVLH